MKRFLKELAFGLVVYVLVMVAEFLVTLPGWGGTGSFDDNRDARAHAMLIEFGLTTPLALIVTFVLAQLVGTPSARLGLRRGLIWAGVALVFYLVVAVGNDNLLLFTVPTFFPLIAAIVGGPVLAGWVSGRRRPAD